MTASPVRQPLQRALVRVPAREQAAIEGVLATVAAHADELATEVGATTLEYRLDATAEATDSPAAHVVGVADGTVAVTMQLHEGGDS